MITARYLTEKMTYHGPELRPHFILSHFKIEDTALVAFRGPCDVKTDHLVDWEDRLVNDFIRAKEMIHFLGEFFGLTLKEGIWIQRLLVSEVLVFLINAGIQAYRDGDDIFMEGKKLTVSIVTASPVSVLLHLGINIDAAGAPVEAAGLKSIFDEARIKLLIETILTRFHEEYLSVHRASVKVRPVI